MNGLKHMKTKLELLEHGCLVLGNLMGNIYKLVSWEILEENSGQNKFRYEQLIVTYKLNFTTT